MTGLARVVAGVAAGVAVAGGLIGCRVHEHGHALPRVTCGSAVTHALDAQTQLLSADRGALTCFRAAAAACRPASIKVVDMGVDTGTDYVFTIEPDGRACHVTERSQGYSANGPGAPPGRVSTASCGRAAVSGRGVELICDGQRVLIPATVSGPG